MSKVLKISNLVLKGVGSGSEKFTHVQYLIYVI